MTLIKVKSRGTDNVISGRRNLIMNGAMKVAQRGTITGHTSGATSCDRFRLVMSGGAQVTTSQDTDVPAATNGFKNSLKIDCTTADTSVAAGDYAILYERMEGQDLQHLLYGTTAAKKVTVQFWVKSAKTGTHIVELFHLDASYKNAQQYTISAANTWEKKILTFDGYQTTAFDNDSNGSLQLAWWLLAGSTYSGGTHNSNTWHNTDANRAVGQVNVLDNTANNFYLTGVQLEVSDSATDFEHRSFDEELLKCYRYCYVWKAEQAYDVFADLNVWNGSVLLGQYALPVKMNHDPAIGFSAAGDFVFSASGSDKVTTNLSLNRSTPRDVQVYATDADHGYNFGVGGFLRAGNNTTASITLESEI